MDIRKYTTNKIKRLDGSGSLIRIPIGWCIVGEKYDVDHIGDTMLIHKGTRRKCRPARYYAEFINEWEAGTIYECWQEDKKIMCRKVKK